MNPQISPSKSPFSSAFSSCCISTPSDFKKQKEKAKRPTFIKLTLLGNPKISSKNLQIKNKNTAQIEISEQDEDYSVFEEDKMNFLTNIRKYKWDEQKQQTKTKLHSDDTDRTLSSLLENFNNDMFSELFISSSVKNKIVNSGSLGSISQVRSQMEISNPTETLVNTLQFTEDR